MSDDSKIIELSDFRVRDPEPTLESTNRAGLCLHKFLLDAKMRTVTCKRCDKLCDPFDALLDITRRWDRAYDEVIYMREQAEKLEQRIAKLKRDERNTKARLKRARGKL